MEAKVEPRGRRAEKKLDAFEHMVMTENFVRSHDKNAENSIFCTHDESTSILGVRYNAGNNCRSKEEREAPYAVDGRHYKCNWTLSK